MNERAKIIEAAIVDKLLALTGNEKSCTSSYATLHGDSCVCFVVVCLCVNCEMKMPSQVLQENEAFGCFASI